MQTNTPPHPTRRYWRWGTTVTVVLMIAVMVSALGLSAVHSAPNNQSGFVQATPTRYPADTTDYTIATVGGTDATTTWPAFNYNGIALSETVVRSNYPNGMTFTTTVDSDQPLGFIGLQTSFGNFDPRDSDNFVPLTGPFPMEVTVAVGAVTNANLNNLSDFPGQFFAPFSTSVFRWIVTGPMPSTPGLPEVLLEGQFQPVRYIDTTREWLQISSNNVNLFMLETGDLSPDEIGQLLSGMVSSTTAPLFDVFDISPDDPAFNVNVFFQGGVTLVLYPDTETWERDGQPGPSLQQAADEIFFGFQTSTAVLDAPLPNCAYLPNPDQQNDRVRLQYLVENLLSRVVASSFTLVLGQLGANFQFGNDWWNSGLEIYFSASPPPYNEVVQSLGLAGVRFVPLSLGNPVLRYPAGAFFEGCANPSALAGASFINWLVSRTSLDVLRTVINEVRNSDATPIEAIEEIFSDDFTNIENAWRSTVNVAPVQLAEVDPIAALEPAPGALFVVGDTLAVPGPSPLPLYNEPGDLLSLGAACFIGGTIEIVQRGALQGEIWYEVECGGLGGWVPESDLLP